MTEICRKVDAIARRYERKVAALNKRLAKETAPFKAPLRRLQSAIDRDRESFSPDQLPERPRPVAASEDSSEWLFDSGREYLEQLKFYKKHQGR